MVQARFLADGTDRLSRNVGKEFSTLQMGPIGYAETSVRNYYCSLRNSPEERSSHLLRGASLKSLIISPLHPTRSKNVWSDQF